MTSLAGPSGLDRDPLADLARRTDGVTGWLRVVRGEPDGEGWLGCETLLGEPTALSRWLERVTVAVTQQQSGAVPPPVTPASYLMGWYLDVPAYAGALAFGITRRVPELDPSSLAVHLHADGYPDGIALLGERFACLPDDPAAGHLSADVADDEQALAAVLRERVASHAAAFHAVFTPGVKIGSRQRWGMVTDILDEALWTSGRAAGNEERGVRDAALVLDVTHRPFTSPSRIYRLLDGRGRRRWTRRRESCCFYFRLPVSEVCFTCPRVSDTERVARASLDP